MTKPQREHLLLRVMRAITCVKTDEDRYQLYCTGENICLEWEDLDFRQTECEVEKYFE